MGLFGQLVILKPATHEDWSIDLIHICDLCPQPASRSAIALSRAVNHKTPHHGTPCSQHRAGAQEAAAACNRVQSKAEARDSPLDANTRYEAFARSFRFRGPRCRPALAGALHTGTSRQRRPEELGGLWHRSRGPAWSGVQ